MEDTGKSQNTFKTQSSKSYSSTLSRCGFKTFVKVVRLSLPINVETLKVLEVDGDISRRKT